MVLISLSDGCRDDDENAGPEAALEFLSKHCRWAVVTLGSNGCLAKCGREVSAVWLYPASFEHVAN